MAIPAPSNKGSGDFKRVPANQIHDAIVDQVIFLGAQKTEYMGTPKIQEKVYIRWQFPGERIEYEKDGGATEGPMVLGRTYTYSFFENAHLGAMLAGWRGKPLTDDEQQSFNLFTILGKNCKVLVTERQGNDGKTYSNIDKVMPCSQGLHKPEGPLVRFHPDAPEDSNVKESDLRPWIQAKLAARQHGEYDQRQGAELHGKTAAEAYGTPPIADSDGPDVPPTSAYADDPDDDLPF